MDYYHEFLQNAATKLKALYELQKRDTSFEWTHDRQRYFEESKKMSTESKD